MQHVYQDLPLLPGPVRVRRSAGGSAGDYYLSEVVLLQHLRDFRMVAGHPGAAVDCLLEEAVQEDSAGAAGIKGQIEAQILIDLSAAPGAPRSTDRAHDPHGGVHA